MPFPCHSCQAAAINGIPCHETGCPDAWRDYDRDCRECGCPFRPETSDRAVCDDCIANAEAPEPVARFTVWTLDVWGNEAEGFEVNDRCKVGTFECDPMLTESSQWDVRLMKELERAGYLKPGSAERGTVDGESDSVLYIDGFDGCPWLQLEREEEG